MTLARRRVLKFAMASTALASLSACGAGNMAGMVTGGGGGGKSWSEIAKSFENLMNQAVDGVGETLESIAMLLEALDDKRTAAVLRGEAKNIESGGTSVSTAQLDEKVNVTEDGLGRVREKMAQAQNFNAEEKKKISEALANYAPAAIKVGLAAIDAGLAIKDASEAGTPTPADGMEIIGIAKDIPTKGPAIIKFAKLSIQGYKDLKAIAKEADIAVPDNDEMPSVV
jgi:hypothetical protein